MNVGCSHWEVYWEVWSDELGALTRFDHTHLGSCYHDYIAQYSNKDVDRYNYYEIMKIIAVQTRN